jgi:protein-L-isoaspartate(D-aspartate) O-methyltransferase
VGADREDASGAQHGAPALAPDPRKFRLIMDLRRRGVTDARTLAAIERVPREAFAPPALGELAYADQPLPIGCGQTISQPYIVAAMTEALAVAPAHRVLEVGTGSGYQTAILAALAREVVSIERWPPLLEQARARLDGLGVANVELRLGDGSLGAPDKAPFDRILVTAAAPDRPAALLAQLADGGVLIAPVGRGEVQELVRYERTPDGVMETSLHQVRFVPLLPGVGGEG